ncbi:hypothetical protein FPCIR_13276 [Fusarium pseudocircinatum]|uniref:Uncharacterized protein n=1 Tax=Fusarium pseudocircinatum TaxID=56676 RepID=A0A8H5KJW1_9HYPO|nr:hypothetical protein FPCIR_13276 [Fusarium pseudocircinatum]
MSAPSPPFFENEIDNEYWSRELQALREVNLIENAEQDTSPYDAQQTEQATQDPQDSLDESPEDESPEDETLWGQPGSSLSPPPSPPPSQSTLALPVPAPPVITGVTEPQTAPPAPFGPEMVANKVLDESIAPKLPKAPQPKKSRAAAKRVPKQKAPKRARNGRDKQPKRITPNQQQKLWDQQGAAMFARLREQQAAEATKAAAGPLHQLPVGGYYPPVASSVYQQPPVPTAAFGAYVPSPALSLPLPPPLPLPPAPPLALAPHLAPPPPPPAPSFPQISPTSMDPGMMPVGQGSEAAIWQPFAPQQQDMDQQVDNLIQSALEEVLKSLGFRS